MIGKRAVKSVKPKRCLDLVALLLLLALLGPSPGCSLPMSRFADGFTNGLGRVPDTIILRDGLPACILMVEGSLSQSPDNPNLLKAASQLYSIYGSQLVKDDQRARRLTQRALEYAFHAAGSTLPGIENARTQDFDTFNTLVSRTELSDVSTLFFLGSVWMDWVQVRKDDLEAIADLPLIQLIMERIVQLDADHRHGTAYLYLAMLAAIGYEEDDIVEDYFGHALDAANGKNLMPHVFYALWLRGKDELESCKRHLNDIIKNGLPDAPSYALFNEFAMQKARKALAELATRN